MRSHFNSPRPAVESSPGIRSHCQQRMATFRHACLAFICLALASMTMPAMASGSSGAVVVDATFTSAATVPVSAESFTAAGSEVNLALAFAPPTGTNLTVVNQTGLGFISGRFSNLNHGQTVVLTYNGFSYSFVANYHGGTGNDLVLQWASNKPYAWGDNADGQLGNNSSVTQSHLPVPVTVTGVLAGKTILAVATGYSHSLALCSDGTLAAWGNNFHGQLGNNSTTASKVPVAVTRTGALRGKTVIAVAAGQDSSVALTSEGTVFTWGRGTSGQLGNNTTTSSPVPVAVVTTGALAGKSVVGIAVGNVHVLARCADGTAVAWGSGSFGLLGNGGTVGSSVPVAVSTAGYLAGRSISAVAAGQNFSLVLCTDGTMGAWGFGQNLGTGASANSSVPVAVSTAGVLAGKTVTAIAAGAFHSLALCSDGTLAAWGQGLDGRLGNNGRGNALAPVLCNQYGELAGKQVTAVTAGYTGSIALCDDGTLAAWGSNEKGQLGNALVPYAVAPLALAPSAIPQGQVFKIATRAPMAYHTVAVAAMPQAFGVAALSGLTPGAGSLTPGFAPALTHYTVNLPNSTTSLTLTPSASDAAAGITVNGMALPSGTASAPIPLAEGDHPITVVVTARDGSASKTYTVLARRATTVNAVLSSATAVPVTAAGYTAANHSIHLTLTHAPVTGASLMVVDNTGLNPIAGVFSNLSQGQMVNLRYNGATYSYLADYFGGTGNDLVLRWAETKVYAWGSNFLGQVGDNTTTLRTLPTPVVATGALAGKRVTRLAVGSGHCLALCSDGTLIAWGNNDSGQLGINSTANSLVPVAVMRTGAFATKTVVAIHAGFTQSLVHCADGSLFIWGGGKLLPEETTNAGILAGKRVVLTGMGPGPIAVCADGTVATWDTTNTIPTPVDASDVLWGKSVTAITGGSGHYLALSADGKLFTWGDNADGQLGNGNTVRSDARPVAVIATGALAGKTVTGIACGAKHNLVMCADRSLIAWGYNRNGTLGNNTTVSSSVPVAVMTSGVLAGKTPIRLAAGADHSLALTSDGTLTTWGDNFFGQMGVGSTSGSRVPMLVLTSTLGAGERFCEIGHAGRTALHSAGLAALPLSTDSRLSSLAMAPGALGQAFVPGTTNYTASVPVGTGAVAVTPTSAHGAATIRVNGNIVASGTASGEIPLNAIPTTITVAVTAANGSATTTYQITINNRAPSFAGLAAATAYQQAVDLALVKVLAKAADADGDAVVLTAAGPSANGGVVTLQATAIRYTPRAGFSGTDTFPVTLRDARGATTVGTVTVAVGPSPGAGGVGVNPPTLTILPGGKVGVAAHGIPGRSYVVQRSVSGLGNWVTLATVSADSSGRVSFTDESPPPGSAFYRLGLP